MRLRIIPELEKREDVVRFAQTPLGKLLLLASFGVLWVLAYQGDTALELVAILTLLTFFPQHRHPLTLAGTFYWLVAHSPFNWEIVHAVAETEGLLATVDSSYFYVAVVASVIAFCAVFYESSRVFRKTWPMNRPVATLITGYVLLICVASYAPMPGMLRTSIWAFLVVLGQYLWFLGYSLLDRGSKKATPITQHFRHYLPFWGYTTTPFPKGAAYLRKIEADTPEKLAISQIKGVKLLAWTVWLWVARRAMQIFVFAGADGYLPTLLEQKLGAQISLGLPRFAETYQAYFAGEPYVWYVEWLSLLATFLYGALRLIIMGHLIIATCRMAGFCALRNSCRPFASSSILEFWNRYYYYFKELLVDFFFYPCYMRYFKKYPRLRRPIATLAAAGFGNVLYHYLRNIGEITQRGPWEALVSFQSYLFYGLLLGTAIVISQQYADFRPRGSRGRASRILGPIWVGWFYAVLHIFDSPDRNLTVASNLSFLFSLFGAGNLPWQ